MIVDCPACATRFRMDAALLPEGGRVVRCSACGHGWRQYPPQEAVKEVKENIAVGENRAQLRADKKTSPPPPRAQKTAVALAPKPAVRPSTSEERSAPAPKASPPADKPAPKKQSAPSENALEAEAVGYNRFLHLIVRVFFPAFIVLSALAYIYRAETVDFFPRTEKIYNLFGLSVRPAGVTLVRPYLQKSGAGLIVQGDLINTHETQTLKIPTIQITLLDNENKVLRTFTVTDFALPELTPGAVTAFSKTIPDPPAETVDVKVRFIKPSAKKPPHKNKAR